MTSVARIDWASVQARSQTSLPRGELLRLEELDLRYGVRQRLRYQLQLRSWAIEPQVQTTNWFMPR